MDRLKQSYKVEFDMVDVFGRLSMNIIAQYIQKLATFHANILDIDFSDLESGEEVYWIVSRVKYNISRYPVYNDEITIETYPGGCDKLFIVKWFEIKDQNKEIIGTIVVDYLVMDAKRQRPINVRKSVEALAKLGCSYENAQVSKIPQVKSPVMEDIRKAYYSELDYNGHMNNSQYIRWSIDMLTEELLKGREIKCIEINYNSPIMCNDEIKLTLENKDGEYFISGNNVLDNKNCFNTKIVLTDI